MMQVNDIGKGLQFATDRKFWKFSYDETVLCGLDGTLVDAILHAEAFAKEQQLQGDMACPLSAALPEIGKE